MSNKAERFVQRTFEEEKKNWKNRDTLDAYLATVNAVRNKFGIDLYDKKIPPEYEKALRTISAIFME